MMIDLTLITLFTKNARKPSQSSLENTARGGEGWETIVLMVLKIILGLFLLQQLGFKLSTLKHLSL